MKNWNFAEELQVEGNSFGSGYPGGDVNICATLCAWLLSSAFNQASVLEKISASNHDYIMNTQRVQKWYTHM